MRSPGILRGCFTTLAADIQSPLTPAFPSRRQFMQRVRPSLDSQNKLFSHFFKDLYPLMSVDKRIDLILDWLLQEIDCISAHECLELVSLIDNNTAEYSSSQHLDAMARAV